MKNETKLLQFQVANFGQARRFLERNTFRMLAKIHCREGVSENSFKRVHCCDEGLRQPWLWN